METISPILHGRLIQSNEFNNESEHFVSRRFNSGERMRKHLEINETGERNMLSIQQVFSRVKEDEVCLVIYDDTNIDNHQHINKTKICKLRQNLFFSFCCSFENISRLCI